MLYGFEGGFVAQGSSQVDALGFNAAATLGTACTPSASAFAKGSYAQLIAATAYDYVGFFVHLDKGGQGTNNSYTLDIAIGGSGSEKIICPDLASMGDIPGTFFPYLPIPIPAGQRIAARVASSATSDTIHPGVIVYGVRA